MRPVDEIQASARDEVAFSNMSSFEVWAENWCGRCVHDGLWGIGSQDAECPILTVSMTGCTPAEWLTTDSSDRYTCIEFRGPDGRDQAPAPPEPIPGQGELIPAEPYVGVRMFADVAAEAREQVVRS